ncbi:hypothetical protein BKA63DRAFT_571819 [Paraphoma chrysanthemicola]|nr:hypothetical protein BKA63DRAFT_571819 [Paraphoma chrysanthemicola]
MACATSVVTSTFTQALDDFKATAGLSPDEIASFQLTTLHDLKRHVSAIQDDQRKKKKQQYMKRLGSFLDAMEQYGKVVEVFLNVSNFVAFIWGPIKFLLLVARNYSEAFNALLDMYQEISENIPQFARYETLFISQPHMQLTLANIYCDILEFHKEALRYFRQRTWKELFHATWRPFSKTVAYLNDNLRRHKLLIESQASIAQYELLHNIQTDSLKRFQEQKKAETMQKRLGLKSWLCSVDVQVRHEEAAKIRHGSSGDWIFQDPTFKKWYEISSCWDPLLWLTGMPGAGKTVLASRIIEACQQCPTARVCFFFCRHTDGERNGFSTIARTMIAQLITTDDIILDLAYDSATKSSEAVLANGSTAKSLLATALHTYDNAAQSTYVVIDGLDEYTREDRKEIIGWFKEQVRSVPGNDIGRLRCLFISQDDGFARKDLSDCTSIGLTIKHTREDIDSYCQMWHNRIEQRFGPLDPVYENVARVITELSGMFLYARLVMWNLHGQPNRRLFTHELSPDNLPSGIEQAYDRVINRIMSPAVEPPSRRQNTSMLLGWLVCTKRTLYWREIQCLVSLDLEQGTLCHDLRFEDDCKELCASLVSRASDDSVTLVHSTAKRYLIDRRHISIPDVEIDLALRCLTYLGFDQFRITAGMPDVKQALLDGDYAFADYATSFWAHHLVQSLMDIGKLCPTKLEDLEEAVDALLDAQWASPAKRLAISSTMEKSLAALSRCASYEKICQAVVSTKNKLLPTGKGPSDDEPLYLAQAVLSIRTSLEALITSPDTTGHEKSLLEDHYGSSLYKCRRINCQFYWTGFTNASVRNRHESKHERAFTCPEDGCPQATIGCVTRQELEKHPGEYHGKNLTTEPEYPSEESKQHKTSNLLGFRPTRFQCEHCPRKFSKAYNLRSHLLTHSSDRPFDCSACGKRFARQHDRTRHEKLHVGDKNFQCRGNLKDGAHWGCGRSYTRGDGLLRHLKSETGQQCLLPLRVEEKEALRAKQQGIPATYQTSAASSQFAMNINPGTVNEEWSPWDDSSAFDVHPYQAVHIPRPATPAQFLPSALLEQYPALASIDWNQIPSTEPEDADIGNDMASSRPASTTTN